jgi:hypothetical protein
MDDEGESNDIIPSTLYSASHIAHCSNGLACWAAVRHHSRRHGANRSAKGHIVGLPAARYTARREHCARANNADGYGYTDIANSYSNGKHYAHR